MERPSLMVFLDESEGEAKQGMELSNLLWEGELG